MEKRIKNRFNEAILQEALRRYGITNDQIEELDGFESFIYEARRNTEEYILRIGHSLRRSIPLIQGEVDWINYLADGGASVASAILSQNEKLVELIDDGQGEHFLVTAFVKAQGKPPWEIGWTPALFETYGRLLGRIHALSKQYRPTDAGCARPQWDDPIMQDVARNLPSSESAAVDRYRAIMTHLVTLPKDDETFGLIHYDTHAANLFVDEVGNMTLFDFDDCAYSWYIQDIAIVLFYMVATEDDATGVTQRFMPHFLRGYSQETRLDAKWLKEIPYFLKQRETDLYGVIHRSFDVNAIDDRWVGRFMQDRKRRIEQDVPFIDFDFESLAQYL